MMTHVLVFSADEGRAERLRRALPYQVVEHARAPREAWRHLRAEVCDLLLVDRELIGDGGTFFGEVGQLPDPPAVLVVVAAEDSEERARLLSLGALAAVDPDLPDESLQGVLAALIERERAQRARLAAMQVPQTALDDFLSESRPMRELVAIARRVARADSTLLLLGETGVGKECLARAIHAESGRRGPFVAVSCAALPEHLIESELFGHKRGAFTGADRPRRGYFEAAHGGTLFLDEIAELPLHVQVKLLRVLQEKCVQPLGSERLVPIDIRLMAATNRDVELELRERRFRSDLYYRLAVVTLRIPPLRERRADIPGLVKSYIQHFSRHLQRPILEIEDSVLALMAAHDWPGNVRELINVVERAVLLAGGPRIGAADLPFGIPAGVSAREVEPNGHTLTTKPLAQAREEWLAGFERRYLDEVLRETGGRVGAAAARAGITPRSLYEKMRRLGLRKESFRAPVPVEMVTAANGKA